MFETGTKNNSETTDMLFEYEVLNYKLIVINPLHRNK